MFHIELMILLVDPRKSTPFSQIQLGDGENHVHFLDC